MTLWIVLTALCLAALCFVILPFIRSSKKLTSVLAAVIVFSVGLSASLYYYIGQPGVPSGAGSMPDSDEVVSSLAERLQDHPDDVNGWTMLGRSYQTMQRYDEAVNAFETAIELEKGQNGQTLVALAIALLERQGGEMSDRAASLFENALALDPNNANALFYAGGAAARRGNTALAADRWEVLLGLNAPPEIQKLLQSKINEWRGLAPPKVASVPLRDAQSDAVVTVGVSLSDAARAELPADALVFIIARDPAQPSPPIAVRPGRLADIPMVVSLGDDDAMVPGRPLSGFSEIEIVVRVSLSGSAMAQSGDWSGSVITAATGTAAVNLVVDQKTP